MHNVIFIFVTFYLNSSVQFVSIGIQANFFWVVAEPSLSDKYFDSARKTYMLTCKIAFPTHPSFHWMEFHFKKIYQKILFFSFLAVGFCPQKICICPQK